MLSRRRFLSLASALPVPSRSAVPISAADDSFLEDLSRRAFLFFWEQSDSHTGLVLDRVGTAGAQNVSRSVDVASTALTGFFLTAMCIGSERRWMDPEEIRKRVRNSLRHFAYEQDHVRGFYYHFVNRKTGKRAWNCELSTIDTALFLAGVVTAHQYFKDEPEILTLASAIYQRVDFAWMLDERTGWLRKGWNPETGFLSGEWNNYSENAIFHILAIGSPTFPVPLRCWYLFDREEIEFGGYRYVGRGPLFTHQYSHAWLDLAGRRDGPPFQIDYFQNSVLATYAHRAYCLALRAMYPAYADDLWGITASDSEVGYVIWGSPTSRRYVDGTVVPCAAGGSLMLAPEICLPVLHNMYHQFGEYVYGRYGFADAFNPLTLWVNPDIVGLDAGITLLSAENLRTGRIWEWFNSAQCVQRAMNQIFESRTYSAPRSLPIIR
ncbi:MAG: hypothetical protein JOY62_14535 [Acidobacteriaceae bacterium]|nr:hypothetical protein [Acidobacteriaceae bacterium]MBV9781177.1 hypothetical protein [Acidobacteriaceae bacterium]